MSFALLQGASAEAHDGALLDADYARTTGGLRCRADEGLPDGVLCRCIPAKLQRSASAAPLCASTIANALVGALMLAFEVNTRSLPEGLRGDAGHEATVTSASACARHELSEVASPDAAHAAHLAMTGRGQGPARMPRQRHSSFIDCLHGARHFGRQWRRRVLSIFTR